jgi:hypothetical protein
MIYYYLKKKEKKKKKKMQASNVAHVPRWKFTNVVYVPR